MNTPINRPHVARLLFSPWWPFDRKPYWFDTTTAELIHLSVKRHSRNGEAVACSGLYRTRAGRWFVADSSGRIEPFWFYTRHNVRAWLFRHGAPRDVVEEWFPGSTREA